jgi:hypothetical protein
MSMEVKVALAKKGKYVAGLALTCTPDGVANRVLFLAHNMPLKL